MQLFDPGCNKCARLVKGLEHIRKPHPSYHAAPVAPFGAMKAKLLIVGLAPGMHGANRTGRPFTGDHAGIMLYETLYKFGFANQIGGDNPNDGLRLMGCRITNAVKCLPPANKPLPAEIKTCNGYLTNEISKLRPKAILALGRIAHNAISMSIGERPSRFAFGHGARHEIFFGGHGFVMFDSFHCSRYNTQTRRLTQTMFEKIFFDIKEYLDAQ